MFAGDSLKRVSLAFVFCFSVFCGLQVIFLSSGNLINHYPFIGPDSYDWYVEGIYLVQLLSGESLPSLFVLRPPTFVLVCALDYLLGGSGYVVGAFLGICIFGTYAICLKLVEQTYKVCFVDIAAQSSLPAASSQVNGFVQSLAAPILAITLTITPINFFTPFVYADRLASFLSLLSVYLLICWYERKENRVPVWATVTAAIAGLTQVYAAIAFGVALVLIAGMRFYKAEGYRLRSLLEPIIAALTLICLIAGLSYAWRITIPHGFTPPYLSLITFDGQMLRFYKHTWGFYLLPIVLILILLGKPTFTLLKRSYILYISLAISIFLMGLLLLYHWQEARFTYYFFPWAMIFLCAFFAARNSFSVGALVIFLLIYSALVPKNYWIPKPRTLELNLRQSWIGDFVFAEPVDRGLNKCEPHCLTNNVFIAGSEGYTQTMMGIYLQLMQNQKNRKNEEYQKTQKNQ